MSVNTTSYYLDDIVGGSDQSGFLSVPTRSMDQDEDGSGPPSNVLREHTFLSPFSPLLRRPGSNAIDDPNVTVSLQECNHVSVVVQVHEPTKTSSSDEFPQLCLFPLVGDANSTTLGKTLTEGADKNRHIVICVNPTAFGKSLPAQVTMETARLVAQVANIESEDWVRKYRFDEVLWSDRKEVVVDNGLFLVATGIAQDALHGNGGGTLLTIGDKRMTTLFGMKAVSRMQAFTPNNLAVSDLGMMGMAFSQILDGLTPDAVMTLSMLEVVDEDSMRDLLEASGPGKTSPTALRLRHISRFPTVEGLRKEPVDSLRGLFHLVKRALGKKPRGHVLCFLSIWENETDQSLGNSTKRTLVTFGSLSSGHTPPGATALENRRMAFMRKSLNGLRGVLRGSMTATTSSWRETILNELLHESLFSGKAVVVASVAAESEAYERSHHTLDYVHRVKVTSTAQSPYLATAPGVRKARTDASISSSSSPEELVKSFGGESTLLRSLTTDPRQRLAKLMKTTPAKPRRLYVSSKDDDSDEDYKPTNYMAVDPGNISFFDPPSESFLEFDKQNPNSPFRTMDEYLEDEKKAPGPEKPSPSRSVQLESTDLFQDAWKAGQDDYEDADDDLPDKAQMFDHYPNLTTPYPNVDGEPEDAPAQEDPEEEPFFTPMTEPMEDPTRRLWEEATIEGVDEIPQLPIVPEREEVGPKEPSLDEELAKEWVDDDYFNQQPPPAFGSPAKRHPPAPKKPKRFDPPESQRRRRKEPKEVPEDLVGSPLEATPPPSSRAPESPPAKRGLTKRPIVHDPEERESRREPFSASTTPTQEETPDPTPRLQRISPRFPENFPAGIPPVTTESKTEFRQEIHSIQEAVEEIRRANSGLWVSSSASLERLQAFQDSQLRIMDQAVAGRKRAEDELDALKIWQEQQAKDINSVRRRYQEQIKDLEKQLEEAAAGRIDVEKIAEDAIAGQGRAEARLGATEKALGESNAALGKKEEDLNAARKSMQQALKDLEETQAKHASLAMDRRDRARRIAELEEKVRDLSEERDRLESALNGSDQDIDDTKVKLAGVAAQLRASKAEGMKRKQRCDELSTELKASRESWSKDKDAAVSLAKMETSNLERELVACRRRIVELETGKSSLETTAEIERKSLTERFEAEKERADRLQAEVETFRMSQELQEDHLNQLLQARLDEAKQLRRDLDRARTERDAAKKHMTSLKAGIEKFQRETKDQVGNFIEEKKAAERRARQVEEESKQRILELEREMEELSESLGEAQQERGEYEQRIEELERQLSAMSITRHEAELLKEKYDRVAGEASEARRGLSEKDVEIQQLRMDLEMSKRQLEKEQETSRSISTSHQETEQLRNEYKERVDQLERQVSRLSANELDAEKLKDRYEGAAKEASEARDELEQKELKVQQLQVDLERSQRQLEHQQEKSKSISASYREADQQQTKYKEQVERLECQLSKLSANERDAERLKERCDSAAKEASAARTQLEQRELEMQQLQMDLEMSRRQLEQQQQTTRSMSASHREAEELKNEYKERVEQLERQLSRQSLVNARDTERLKERIDSAAKEASAARTELDQRELEMQQLQLDLEMLKQQLERQQQSSRSISVSHRETEQLKNEYKERVEQLERQLSRVSSVNERDMERLEERCENASKEASAARSILEERESEMQQLQMDLEMSKRQLEQQQQTSKSISASHRETEELKNEYQERVEQLERQLSRLSSVNERETERLKERYEGAAKRACTALTELEQKEVEIQQLRMDWEVSKREFEQLQQKTRSISVSHRDAEELKNEYKDRVEQLERQISRLSASARDTERRYQGAANRASEARTELEQKEVEIQQLRMDQEISKREFEQLQQKTRLISVSHQEAAGLNNEYKDRVEQLERQVSRLSANERDAERLQERYEGAAREASVSRTALEQRALEIQQLRLDLEQMKRQLDKQEHTSRSIATSNRETEQLKNEYKERMEQLERQLSRRSVNERNMERLKERYEAATKEASTARALLERKESDNSQLKVDLESLKRQLDQNEEASRTMSLSHLEAEQLNQQYKKRVERLEREIASLLRSERNAERLKERYESAARDASSARTDLDKKELEIQQLRRELELSKQQLDQQDHASRSLSASQRELSSLKDEYKERVEQLEKRLSRVYMTERDADRLKERYETASSEARSARKELGEKDAEIQTLRLDLELSKRQLEQQEQASRASQSAFEDERMALNRHKIRHLERENEELRSEIRSEFRVTSEEIVTLAELRMEQSRRLEAEDLIAIMAQRAKQSLEERDEEVRSLKQMLCIQMEEKEAENRILRDRLLDRDRAAIEEEGSNRRARSSSLYPTERRTSRGASQT